MRQNALLRSGKGLANPATARKKVAHVTVVETRAEQREDHFAIRNGVRCAGVHLIVDLHGAQGLDDIDLVEATLRRCVEAANATLLHIHVHHFRPNGVSGVAVLAESHISIHTWPDAGYAALDVFMCGKASPDACIPVLREAFKAERVEVSEILRGQGA
jgi:S-adenosylmethionine decarboxylase